jgi:hypothetical protein
MRASIYYVNHLVMMIARIGGFGEFIDKSAFYRLTAFPNIRERFNLFISRPLAKESEKPYNLKYKLLYFQVVGYKNK